MGLISQQQLSGSANAVSSGGYKRSLASPFIKKRFASSVSVESL